jgi:hypothetical protein
LCGPRPNSGGANQRRTKVIQTLSIMLTFVTGFIKEEIAQDGFEYLLVVGGVSVAIVAAMIAVPGLTDSLVTAVCTAISGVITIVCA